MKRGKQNRGRHVFMLMIIIIILIIEIETFPAAAQGVFKRTVRVQNDLGGGIHLTTHCKSADDDLGVRDLANGQCTQWSFRLNFVGRTLFWCWMKWNNVQGKFDVYSYKRDLFRCLFCRYSVRQDGAYAYNSRKKKWKLFYAWKK